MVNYIRIIILIILFSSIGAINAQTTREQIIVDSIISLRKLSMVDSLIDAKKIYYARQAMELSNESKIDSTILKSGRILSVVYMNTDRLDDYRFINSMNMRLATKLKDTSALAVANNNLGYYFLLQTQSDSAFYYYTESLKYYKSLKNNFRYSINLSVIADIQDLEKDYIGAENNAILGITVLENEPLSEDILDQKWILYNILGSVSLNQNLYEDALSYHDKALDIGDKMVDGLYNSLYSIHNQARVYRKMGDLETSLDLYKKALNRTDLYKEDPEFYALIIDNIAETRFLNGDKNYNEILKLYQRAYKISDSLEDQVTKLAVTIDLTKFYAHLKQQDSALKFGYESKLLAKTTNNNEILLEAYTLLSELTEGEEKVAYLNNHIKLSDSLINNERAARNKFARVRFETDQIKAENVQISRERLWFLILSIGLLVTVLLVYVIYSQRAKNRELKLSQQQQIANEEIYNLMLAQQDKMDEGRAHEKKRISEELHDGILGRLFGTRLSLDSLNSTNTDDAIKNRGTYINELKCIEQEIRKISHDLNTDFIANSGFVDIVKALVENQTNAYQLSNTLEIDENIDWEELSNKDKIHLYRIVQESLQNVYKHANAKHVKIGFELKNDVLLVSINDDGSGFELTKAKKGIGIKNINSRVVALNGEVAYNSAKDEGTNIIIKVPM